MSEEDLLREYDIGPEIGRGRFGAVFHCTCRRSGQPFALKSVDRSLLSDPLDRALADREADLHRLAAAGNPAVVQLHAAYQGPGVALHLVLDLCPGPDLLDRVSGAAPLSEPEAAPVMAQLVKAIAACHRRGVAHRDVKLDNMVFDAQGRMRLADFGSAERFGPGKQMRGLVGTPWYVAPEVVARREYGEKVDVWSAGVVMYMMLGGVPPFGGETAAEVFEAVVRANLRFPARNFGSVSPAAKGLMRRMMCKDVSRRLSAEQVLCHPWITSGGQMRSVD